MEYKKAGLVISLYLFLALCIPTVVDAHPGNTDSSGCHTCRTNCPDWGLSYNEYHCHNAKSSYQPESPIRSTYGAGGTGYTQSWPEYEYSGSSYTSTPTCPSNSTYDYGSGSCSCIYGYAVKNGQCVSGNSICWSDHGYNSRYDSISKSCECDYGYDFDSYGQCESRDSICEDKHGYNAEYDILSDSCECKSGYIVDASGSSCIDADYYCRDNYGYDSSYDSLSNSCECDYGYEMRGGICVEEEDDYYYAPAPVYVPPTYESNEYAPATREYASEPVAEFQFDWDLVEILDPSAAGQTTVSAVLRSCPSKTCSVIRYYAEGADIELIGKYDDEWFEVRANDDDGRRIEGWMHTSVLEEVEVQIPDVGVAAVSTSSVNRPASKGLFHYIKALFGFSI